MDIPVESLSRDAIGYFIETGEKAGRIPEGIDGSDVPAILSRYRILKNGRPTMAAVLPFHEDPYSFNYGAMVKIGRFDSERTLLRDDMVSGPMIEVPEKAMRLLYSNYIPPTYGYGGLTVSGHMDYDYPEKAVRELIVNSVVHMDYSLQQPVEISAFDDRMEMFSAGGLPKGLAIPDLKKRHRSIRRNETLASVFYSAGYVENWAQGIAKVMKECAENGNPEPEFSLELGGLMATMYKRSRNPGSTIPEHSRSRGMETTLDQRILEAMSGSATMSTKRLSEKLGVPSRTIRRHLAHLVEAGQIVRVGSNSSTEYAIKDELTV